MNTDKAKELLSFHSCRNEDCDNPKWENGFLGSLRPFRGKLHKENFIEVIECLRALQAEIAAPTLDNTLVYDIISIIHSTRTWIAPNGMLSENHLLTKEQTMHLSTWADIIECCFLFLLEGAEEEAFMDYEDYCHGSYLK
ncbi:MAG: hypothetical protein ACTTJ7_02820 [Treponema sp.]